MSAAVRSSVLIGILVLTNIASVLAVEATTEELARSSHWVADYLGPDAHTPPFSFLYGRQPSSELLKTWAREQTSEELDNNRKRHTVTYIDPATKLAVRCVAVEYRNFPTVEWTIYLKNTGPADTLILENVQALDIEVTREPTPGSEFLLHHHRGSVVVEPVLDVPAGQADYEPLKTRLAPHRNLRIAPRSGRPCGGEFPYFNVEIDGASRGLIAVIGWPGKWAAEFTRDSGTGLRLRAGQERTHFQLHPGEEVRTPLIVLQFWQGDRIRSQNLWRRWMLAYNVPRPGGKPLAPMTGGFCGYYFGPNLEIAESGEKEYIDRYAEEGLKPDYWWIDAGWYECQGHWTITGTWEIDTKRFPNRLRGVISHAKSKGINKSIVWFEPERVHAGTWLANDRPQWLLSWAASPTTFLLDLGNPEACRWTTEHISRMMKEEGVDAYRQDFNMDPAPYWEANDADDRKGITEMRYVAGYLAFWDGLIQRDPSLLIDSCASGGHRNDLETMRRSVPLWRTDAPWDPIGQQCQTYGISSWLPYYGTGVIHDDPYVVRSDMAPFFLLSWDMRRKDLNYENLRRMMEQWRGFADCYLGDYYPLTSYSREEDVWMAWQFDCPERQGGLVQAFRRAESPFDAGRFKLHGLDPEGKYAITDLDTGTAEQTTGRELMESGLSISIPARRTAVVLMYRKLP